MFLKIFLLLVITISSRSQAEPVRSNENLNKFPGDFLFGAATSAYQIEGAWNVNGRGSSIWDDFTHNSPEKIADRQNGDIGPNSYEFFEQDIKAIKSMEMNFYRFSIAWSRVLPSGDIADINEAGIEYYDRLINKMLEYNIEPMVTMYHFDLPSNLQRFGGWANPIMIKYFEAYANLLYARFGNRVKYWFTFNEPMEFCSNGYGGNVHAPDINQHGIGEYLCVHNILKAHATAYRLYESLFKQRFNGQVGIVLNPGFAYSNTNNTVDVNRCMQFTLGWLAHPIFSSKGDYPAIMIEQIAENSMQENRSWSRLPVFSEKWINMIRGSADFLALNYYTSFVVERMENPEGKNPSHYRDKRLKRSVRPEWKRAKSTWLYSIPSGLGDILRRIKKEYNNPPVILSEIGWSDDGELNDAGRIEYLRVHLKQVLDVLRHDDCNLKAFTVWSLIDNFEWAKGYTEKFGLFSVNMTSPKKERTPKKSAEFMRIVITTRTVPDST